MALQTFTSALALPVGQVLLGAKRNARSVPETYQVGAVALLVGVVAILVAPGRRAFQWSRSTTYRASALSNTAPSGSEGEATHHLLEASLRPRAR